jgi:DNA-binding Xre family transcriptional regulator
LLSFPGTAAALLLFYISILVVSNATAKYILVLLYKCTKKSWIITMSTTIKYRHMATIQWRLKEIMQTRRITIQALADELGVHRTTIIRWRDANTLPAIDGEQVDIIADALTKLSVPGTPACKVSDLIKVGVK